jgi:transcriptional regulator with XRE-family HTH domain
MEEFRNNLAFLREKRGLKQKEVAELVGVGYTTWSDYERGRSQPSLSTLKRISEVLQVSIDELLSNVYLSDNFDDNKKTTESIPNGIPNGIPKHIKSEENQVINEPKSEYKRGYTEDQQETIYAAMREIISTQKSLIDSLNAQILSLKDEIVRVKKG